MQIRKLFELVFHRLEDKSQNASKSAPGAPISSPSAGQKYPRAKLCDMQSDLLSQVRDGRLVIPDDMPEIPDRLFDAHGGNHSVNQLVSVVVPGTVKSIGERAFGDCKNLEEVILSEGLERIGSNAFTGCEKLKRLQLPASIKEIDGRAFIHCGLTEPVFSADGKVLICYPPECGDSEYAVPEGVEKIVWGAFWEPKHLTKVTLPESLKLICSLAFIRCDFTEIDVPKNTEIEDGAFSFFSRSVRIIREGGQNALEEKLDNCRTNGIPFLHRQRMKLPQTRYWNEDNFRSLAKQCAMGDVGAMERMGDYFSAKAAHEEETAFYQCAAQFWRTRAYRYGSETAKRFLLAWCEEKPNARMASPGLDEKLKGAADGELLNAIGFPFFEPGREYSLSGVDQDGVVEVSSWESDEGPDEDGFGREEFYDWWYLNEYLVLPKGVGYIHSYSNLDKRNSEDKFRALHDRVAAIN